MPSSAKLHGDFNGDGGCVDLGMTIRRQIDEPCAIDRDGDHVLPHDDVGIEFFQQRSNQRGIGSTRREPGALDLQSLIGLQRIGKLCGEGCLK